MGKTTANNFDKIFEVVPRAVQEKLNSEKKVELSISELAILSRYLQCDIDDLIIFEGDNSINIPLSTKEKQTLGIDTSPEDVINTIKMNEQIDFKYQIKNIYEFLLYLPLMDESILKDIVFRCVGNLNTQRDYVKKQLNYLYKKIPDSPAKTYADFYRDNVLRFKGPPCEIENRDIFSNDYFNTVWKYRNGYDYDYDMRYSYVKKTDK